MYYYIYQYNTTLIYIYISIVEYIYIYTSIYILNPHQKRKYILTGELSRKIIKLFYNFFNLDKALIDFSCQDKHFLELYPILHLFANLKLKKIFVFLGSKNIFCRSGIFNQVMENLTFRIFLCFKVNVESIEILHSSSALILCSFNY